MSLEDFKRNIEQYIEDYPNLAEDSLLKSARKVQKLAKEAAPVGTSKRKKLKDSFRVRLEGHSLDSIEATVRSTSSHFHLVESGHEIVYKGKSRGFYQGTHFFHRLIESQLSKIKQDEEERFYKSVKRAIGRR